MKIDHAVFAGSGIEILKRPHAAQAAHEWIDDHLRERGGNGGVKCVAPRFQYLRAHICRARLRTYNDALHDTPSQVMRCSIQAQWANSLSS